ncbi:MFS transporter [Tropicibacter sp. R16_0]|uniref:MFS transporter n=1 Tax=Tropicibacter sp. R16_0 TaxID=2821102 RepID=UPI001ADBDB24|nr:MFS transporter [Tropicibacter sp. R16_0]MBO9448873.1 MFS transporter [Tropicibacter sp. R16_0]
MTTQTTGAPGKMQLFYGLGGVANGVFSNGLSFFLLIYYNLVIGLPAEVVGFALSIALIFDAISDPLVGYLSDNWKSRMGKRHPFIFLSIVPTAFLFWLIWNPPASLTTDGQLFWFLLLTTIGLRVSMTLYDVPHNAMLPELTSDYNARTLLSGHKVSVTWISGQIIVIAMYTIWLVPTDFMPYGILNQAGYQEAGLVSAFLIAAAILISALGLLSYKGQMTEIAHEPTKSAGGFFRQFASAAGLPALRAVFLSSAVYAVGAGVGAALWSYLMSFYWELSNDQISLILVANLAGALIAGFLIKVVSNRDNKKAAAINLSILSTIIGAGPYLLRWMDLFPANGTDALIYVLFAHGIVQVGVIVWTSSVLTSMTADVVEVGLHKSGFQNEGIITASITFILKAGTAGGLAVSGVFLAFVGFPSAPDQTNLTPEIVSSLGFNYALLTIAIYAASIVFLLFYNLDKKQFEEMVSNKPA